MVKSNTGGRIKNSAGGAPPVPSPPSGKKAPLGKAQDLVVLARVIDDKTKKPISGAKYEIADTHRKLCAKGETDWQGTVKLDVAEAGTYKVRVIEVPPEKPANAADAKGKATAGSAGKASGGAALAEGSVPAKPKAAPGEPTVIPVGAGSRAVRVRLTGLHFETDKSFLLPSAMNGIQKLVHVYEENPGAEVLVTGHADRAGPADYNLALSNERAQAIADYLTDNVKGWLDWYQPSKPASKRWGAREDEYMKKELAKRGKPFKAGPMNNATRGELIREYMALDGTTLPKGTVLKMHGCGEYHPEVPTADGVAEARNRRAEVFFFTPKIDPPPRPRCPAPGCPEYPEWVRRTVRTIDLDVDADLVDTGWLDVFVFNDGGNPVRGARVRISGPANGESKTDDRESKTEDRGAARFPDLKPGDYQVTVARDGAKDIVFPAKVTPGTPPPTPPPPTKETLARLGAKPSAPTRRS